MTRLLAFLACFSLNLMAQRSVTRTFQIQWTKQDLAVSSGDLTVSLPGAVPHWVVGVKVTPGASEHVEVANASLKTGPYGLRRLNQVSLYPRDAVSVTGSTISIGPPGEGADHTLLVYVELATPRTLSIAPGNGPPESFVVSTAAVVADGSLIDTMLHGDFELALISLRSGPRPPPAGVVPSGPQNLVLNMADLRSHLSRYVDFAKVNPGAGPQTLVARVHIGSDGTVQKVTCRDQSALCNDIVGTIGQWSFHPYLVHDQPAPVAAEIPITVMPTGEVVSAVSPGADLR